jgi:hypothetical protein
MYGLDLWETVSVAAGYVIAVVLSGPVVRFFVGPLPEKAPPEAENSGVTPRFDIGAIIGKCENIIVMTFVLAGAYTGLALIFTAKSIVRREDIAKDPRYYLGGTLVNFVFSLLVACGTKVALDLLAQG